MVALGLGGCTKPYMRFDLVWVLYVACICGVQVVWVGGGPEEGVWL